MFKFIFSGGPVVHAPENELGVKGEAPSSSVLSPFPAPVPPPLFVI